MNDKRMLMKFMATLPDTVWDQMLVDYDRWIHLSFEYYMQTQHPNWWFKFQAWKAVNYGNDT